MCCDSAFSYGPWSSFLLEAMAADGGGSSKSDQLLAGLKDLLAAVEAAEEPTDDHDDDSDALFSCLQRLVNERPNNLLQELRSLVTRFSKRSTGKGEKGATKGKSGKGTNLSSTNFGNGTGSTSGAAPGTGAKGKSKVMVSLPDTPDDDSSWVKVARKGHFKKALPKPPESGRPQRGDWTGHVTTSAEELTSWISSSKEPVVAIPTTSSEAELMWPITDANSSVDCLFVFNYQTEEGFAEATEESLGVAPDLVPVPLHFSNGLRFVQRFTLRRGAGAPKPKVADVKVQVSTSAMTGSVVLRAKTRKAVAGTWETVRKQAGFCLRSWAMSNEGFHSTDIRDTWGWEQIGKEDIQSLLRINVTKADHMLKFSGACQNGMRWFIEPLKWEAPLKTTVPPAVEWVEGYEQIGAAAKVACEMAQRHGLGLVLGRRQIGVRKARQLNTGDNQQSQARRRIWKFLGWTLRATRKDNTSHLEIKAGDETTVLASSDFGRVDGRIHESLPGERRVNFGGAPKLPAQISSFSNFPLSKAGFGINRENMDVDKENTDGKIETERENGVSGSPPKKKPKVGNNVPAGLEVVPNAGQGNCLFHALSDACKIQGQSKGHGVLRAMAVIHLRKYKEAYEIAWDMCTPDAEEKPMDAADFDKYLDLVAMEGAWGGGLEITAISNTLNVCIRVFTGDGTFIFNPKGQKGTLTLRFNNKHFEALKGQIKREADWGTIKEAPRVLASGLEAQALAERLLPSAEPCKPKRPVSLARPLLFVVP
eukprot:s2085_g3.t1